MPEKLQANPDRILAAITHLIAIADARGYQLTQYDVVKSLFLADRQHLNLWGRPITYDNYVAMEHGPVPSLSYNALKGDETLRRSLKITHFPWKAIDIGKGRFRYTEGQSDEYGGHLSDSDRECLDDAFNLVSKLTFGQIRRLTHEDPAYKEAWVEGGDRAAYDMKLDLMFEEPNAERAEDLIEFSQYVRAG